PGRAATRVAAPASVHGRGLAGRCGSTRRTACGGTIALAVGVQRMAARHVLIRRLPAVETLGCATVICTDKTGTHTTGVMQVRELWGRDHAHLLFAAAACCDAEIRGDGQTGVGDPTELAILLAA